MSIGLDYGRRPDYDRASKRARRVTVVLGVVALIGMLSPFINQFNQASLPNSYANKFVPDKVSSTAHSELHPAAFNSSLATRITVTSSKNTEETEEKNQRA